MHRRIIPLVPPLPTSEPSHREPQSTLAHPFPPDLSPPLILTPDLPSSTPAWKKSGYCMTVFYLSHARFPINSDTLLVLRAMQHAYTPSSSRFSRFFSVESRKRTYGGARSWSVLSFLQPFNCIWSPYRTRIRLIDCEL